MAQILELLKPFWLPIAKGFFLVAGGLALWLQAKKSGEQTIKQQNVENTLKAVEENDKIKNDLNRASDVELDKLLEKYTRD